MDLSMHRQFQQLRNNNVEPYASAPQVSQLRARGGGDKLTSQNFPTNPQRAEAFTAAQDQAGPHPAYAGCEDDALRCKALGELADVLKFWHDFGDQPWARDLSNRLGIAREAAWSA